MGALLLSAAASCWSRWGGKRAGEVGEWGNWAGGVLCLYPWNSGAVSVEGNVYAVSLGNVAVIASCWSWWGGKRR